MLFSLYYLIYLMSYIECNCDGDGSLDGKCDDAGKCSCKTGFDGVKCNTCAKKFFGFPQCRGIFFFFNFSKIMLFSFYYLIYLMSFIEGNCDGDGSLDGKCDDAGKCSCKPGFDGVKCNTCANNFFGFPQCRGMYLFFSIFLKLLLFTLYYLSYIFYRV